MAPYSRSYGRTLVRSVLEAEGEGRSLVGRTIRVGGWVKTGREAGAGAFAFLEVNDGSCFQNIQVRRAGQSTCQLAGCPGLPLGWAAGRGGMPCGCPSPPACQLHPAMHNARHTQQRHACLCLCIIPKAESGG